MQNNTYNACLSSFKRAQTWYFEHLYPVPGSLGQWGRSPENVGGWATRQGGTSPFSLLDPSRRPPAFSIVPTNKNVPLN